MFTPLVPIEIKSIYGGPLPLRMAKCTPDMHAAIRNLKQHLEGLGLDLVLSDLCVPKIRFCNIDGEGRQGQVVR